MESADDKREESTTDAMPSRSRRLAGASQMDANGYKKNSHGQYDAHRLSMDMLLASIGRVVAAASEQNNLDATVAHDSDDDQEPNIPSSSSSSPYCLRIADLGAADGSNSVRTLQYLMEEVSNLLPNQFQHAETSSEPETMVFHVCFEEHPDSDEIVLRETLRKYDEWFQKNFITYDLLMKSFYLPLFEKNSIDMLLSYICLHWLDTSTAIAETTTKTATTSTTSIPLASQQEDKRSLLSSWKTVQGKNSYTDFVMVQEENVNIPNKVVEYWKNQLASKHLVKFLVLRAYELKPRIGEMSLVMVGAPYVWGPSALLTKSIQACIERGEVRPSVLGGAIIPYYVRTMQDIKDAIIEANHQMMIQQSQQGAMTTTTTTTTLDDSSEIMPETSRQTIPPQLELLDTREIKIDFRQIDINVAFDMLWSIHQGAIRATGDATDEELEAIRWEARRRNRAMVQDGGLFEATYLACIIRRKQ